MEFYLIGCRIGLFGLALLATLMVYCALIVGKWAEEAMKEEERIGNANLQI